MIKKKSKSENKIYLSLSDYRQYYCQKCNSINFNFINLPNYGLEMIKNNNCKNEFAVVANKFWNIMEKHPRKKRSIKNSSTEIKPENSKEEYCYLIDSKDNILIFKTNGYNCTNRINNWFTKLQTIDENNSKFSIVTEYNNPDNLIIKFKDFYHALALKNSIIANANKISYKIIEEANNMELNFKNKWQKCYLFSNIFMVSDIEYIKSTLKQIQTDIDVYNITNVINNRSNILEILETFGIYVQTNIELQKNNLDYAAKCLLHYTSNINTNFIKQKYLENKNIYNEFRNELQKDFINLLNTYYEYENSESRFLELENINLSNAKVVNIYDNQQKQQIKTTYTNQVLPLLNKIIDENIIKKLTKYVNEEEEPLTKEQSQNNNILMTYLLYGFKLQMKLELTKDNYRDALLAIEYVLSRLNSPLYRNYQKDLKDELLKNNLDNLKSNLQNIYNIYYKTGKLVEMQLNEQPRKPKERKLLYKRKK